MVTYEEFAKNAAENGLTEVTREEFAEAKTDKFSIALSIKRVVNARNRAKYQETQGEVGVVMGFPLGGRDNTYKGITLEQAKAQRIPVFLPDKNVILEHTVWGHFKGKHGYRSEMEVTVKETSGDDGRTFIDRTIRNIRSLDEKVTPKMLLPIAYHPDALEEGLKYEYVALVGQMGRFDQEVMFEGGQKTDKYPVVFNKLPCLNFIVGGERIKVRCQLAPTKNAQPLIEFPEFSTPTEIGEFETCFRDSTVLVVGFVRRWDHTEDVDWVNLMATGLWLVPDGTVPGIMPKKEAAQSGLDSFKPGAAPSGKPGKADAKPAPGAGVADATNRLTVLKTKVSTALAVLGPDTTDLSAIRQTGGISPSEASDSMLEKVVARVRVDLTAKKPAEPAPAATPKAKEHVDIEEAILGYLGKHPDGVTFDDFLLAAENELGVNKGVAEEAVNLLIDKGLAHEPVIGLLKKVG